MLKGGRCKFGPECRIKDRQDFLRIQSSARKYRTKFFLLALDPKEQLSTSSIIPQLPSRLGITVTKRIDKRAARRNRLKRRVREVFRRKKASFTIAADLVVVALTGSTELDYKQVEHQLVGLFLRSGLMKNKRRSIEN